ncbi:tRNA-dihydrouridine(20) synthase (NAD(+)) Ecym_2108 [Eremothecium cymbalariae DBVPG|uniref:tRNA-dihydrouridine(20) synthase [NAD(P)+] n=1 Tax=Eremothecium cymbalariae (strain CBS 270.75 / DBVPG 7215 / KCTC 17166 / NRRL Y-17582) TaxID=931890 RepID=G8JPL2_ERECY|nr:Hypothetical protein Ecym_2108 [Eremothecium cymbalariae DBVPG\
MVSYAGKVVLAPMVRAGELPTRLLALKYGADLVWGPEIIDKKVIQCEREVNKDLNTVDFVVPSRGTGRPPTIVFRTAPEQEQGKLIFQLGTAAPSLAVEAANKVIQDVDGIDVNAGCPKHFSIHAGMGAALLKTPDKLCNILKELVEKVGKPNQKPISVKIRILDDEESTLSLVTKLCATGVSNLTVHCRTTPMRNREHPIRNYVPGIYKICQSSGVSFIMNGSIKNKLHFLDLRSQMELPENVGGMIAEAAEENATVFSEVPLPWYKVIPEYLQLAQQFQNHPSNTKYMLNRMVPGKSPFYQYFVRCRGHSDFNYVAQQLGADGKCITDPSDYLERCRAEDKKVKQGSKYPKAQVVSVNTKRSSEGQLPQESKKIKTE